jgi:uncharacterized CHY-type Zn-finger protein
MNKYHSNKYAIEANKKAQRIKKLNEPSGYLCGKCKKTLSFMAFSLSSLCAQCERELKEERKKEYFLTLNK